MDSSIKQRKEFNNEIMDLGQEWANLQSVQQVYLDTVLSKRSVIHFYFLTHNKAL
jgi:hypothetical protein